MMHEFVAPVHSPGRRWARRLGLLLLAVLGPACYSSSGHNYMAPTTPMGPGILFADSFVTFSPPTNWSAPATTNATVVDNYIPPNYFLTMSSNGTRSGSASTTSAMSFTSQPLTVTVNIRYSASTSTADLGSLLIVDAVTPATVYASAVVNGMTNNLALQVGAGAVTNVTLAPGTLYTLTFKVDGSNNATWNANAVTTTAAAFGAHTTKVQLAATWGAAAGTASVVEFNDVVVSDP
jgi:hypothetical protein